METTVNYQLKKPSYTEGANVQLLNENADIVDAELAAQNEQLTTLDAAKAAKSITAPVTLTAADWTEDAENGWWTQGISNSAIVDGTKIDISFDESNLTKVINDGCTMMIKNVGGDAKVYSFGNVPSSDLTAQLEIRQVTT